MIRRLFNLATILSLLLIAGILLHWPISHYRQDALIYSYIGSAPVVHQWSIESRDGGIMLGGIDIGEPGEHRLGLRREATHDHRWATRDLSFHSNSHIKVRQSEIVYYFFIPDWAFLLLSLILPTIWVTVRRRRQRLSRMKEQGFCIRCGYDMRATPNQCPECGAEPDHVFAGVIPVNRLAK